MVNWELRNTDNLKQQSSPVGHTVVTLSYPYSKGLGRTVITFQYVLELKQPYMLKLTSLHRDK